MFDWLRDKLGGQSESQEHTSDAGETTGGARFTSHGQIPPVAQDGPSRPSASDMAFGSTTASFGPMDGFKLGTKLGEKLFGKKGAPVTGPHDVASPDRPPTPPEFAALDPDLVEKLWRSRKHYWATRDKKDEDFWDGIRQIPAADLHTLVQVARGAKSLGLWDSIGAILQVYTYTGSNGIKFEPAGAPPLPAGQWGKDLQDFVAKEHKDGEKYTWFRNNSGAGNPGMHIGLDNGAGHLDLHWDPTNPMQAVGTGSLQLIDTDFGPGAPVVVPKGQAIYSPAALAQHALDIGWAGKGLQKALGKKSPSEQMLKMSLFDGHHVPKTARHYAQLEEDDTHVHDRGRASAAITEIRAAASQLDTLAGAYKTLAMQDDAHAIDEHYRKFEAARSQLWHGLAALVKHLVAEAPGSASDGWDKADEWTDENAERAEKKITELQGKRAGA